MAKKKYPENTLHPRYWPTWLGIGGLHICAWLPWKAKIALGKGIGQLALTFARERRHFTEVNIRLAFPEKSPEEQKQLVKETFLANGIGIMEIATSLVRDTHFLQERLTFLGKEHFEQARARGKGVLVMGFHFSVMDLAGALHSPFHKVDIFYKPHKNKVFNRFIEKGRERNFGQQINYRDLKTAVRRLRQGEVVWYTPDQDFGRKVSVFAPFFGVQAASITMTSRIVRMTGCSVVPVRVHRNKDDFTYTLEFLPPLENFPSGDDVADATQVNQVIEKLIRIHPEQYLWMHRRFKTRPDPEDPSYY
ncbi:LpxL/LpxP family Kdo(2)-lipid IV(A) lauroyl/palmitoleoyl acyltransferase [Marinospirillum sp.]|uniref:LpxL/LpxP family Kdo(2)-lipid IV(A) lauroyl/palmitoleoyl acyltransferase n=1 Tax=Marinospirillum sp. TaxID=2183934 RepID=UPI00384D740D